MIARWVSGVVFILLLQPESNCCLSHRSELEPHIGEVCTASVACGVMGYGGNKGAAAVSFSLFRRRVVLVSSHFAAHQVWRVCSGKAPSGCSGRCKGAACPYCYSSPPHF